MKIGILGGTFNPPHWGHQLMAQQVLEFCDLDQVWLTPCFKHTFEKDLIPARHRLKMAKFISSLKIKVCNDEIKNKLSGQTIELMNILASKYPQHEFKFIIGSDNLGSFKKWGQWQKLVSTWPFLVFPRPGFSDDLKKYGLDKSEYKFEVIKHPLLVTTNLSSTIIRQRIKQDLDINNLVPKSVAEYIKIDQLYQN